MKEEAFLEYINQVLMTGEVAGLFPKDELDLLLNDIRPIMKAESPGTRHRSPGTISWSPCTWTEFPGTFYGSQPV